MKHILSLQNKTDLVKQSQAKEQYEQVFVLTQGKVAEEALIIPISAHLKYSLQVVFEDTVKKIPLLLPRGFISEP